MEILAPRPLLPLLPQGRSKERERLKPHGGGQGWPRTNRAGGYGHDRWHGGSPFYQWEAPAQLDHARRQPDGAPPASLGALLRAGWQLDQRLSAHCPSSCLMQWGNRCQARSTKAITFSSFQSSLRPEPIAGVLRAQRAHSLQFKNWAQHKSDSNL